MLRFGKFGAGRKPSTANHHTGLHMDKLNLAIWVVGIALGGAFVYLLYNYIRGLWGSPRELFILFITKIIEYAAYGATNMCFVLYLSSDVGLSDIEAGSFIGFWSMGLTLTTIFVGAVCDAIGIKKTLLIGTIVLIISRIVMPFTNNFWIAFIFGFIPLALGVGIMGPVLSVGIKRFTTKEGTAMGFALFYTLMNVGWALGGIIFDTVRGIFGETAGASFGAIHFSTYQIIFLVGFFLSIPNLILIIIMRDRVRMTEEQGVVIDPKGEELVGSTYSVAMQTIKNAVRDTGKIFGQAVREKAFWYFLFMLGILVFVRLVFYHFHYTFPKYGIRVLGEGVKIGNIYGVLNPTMIVFLVPLVGYLTRKISSYKMMVVGTTISAVSVFIATMPAEIFSPWMNTWFAELIFNRWLNVPAEMQQPVFFTLIVFIFTFTVGESIWSPRLMQFTAEIAPVGREGSYIALSYLPYFGAKFIAGPMSGWLVATYTPEGAASYPNHYWVWIWIGGMAALSPLGLIVFRKLFHAAEEAHKNDHKATA